MTVIFLLDVSRRRRSGTLITLLRDIAVLRYTIRFFRLAP